MFSPYWINYLEAISYFLPAVIVTSMRLRVIKICTNARFQNVMLHILLVL
jgi:hypothetical protein